MKIKLLRICGIKVSIAIFFAATVARGSTLLSLDLETLTRDADHICIGRVLDSTSFMKKNRIYTLHRVEITEAVATTQAPGDIVEVVTEGGRSEYFSQKVSGAAELEVGLEYLFFLECRGDPDITYPVGMSQGAYPILADEFGTMRFIHPPANLPRLVTRDALNGGRLMEASPWLLQKTRLDTILQDIGAVIRGIK